MTQWAVVLPLLCTLKRPRIESTICSSRSGGRGIVRPVETAAAAAVVVLACSVPAGAITVTVSVAAGGGLAGAAAGAWASSEGRDIPSTTEASRERNSRFIISGRGKRPATSCQSHESDHRGAVEIPKNKFPNAKDGKISPPRLDASMPGEIPAIIPAFLSSR